MTRGEIARFLREFADELDDGPPMGRPDPDEHVDDEGVWGPKRISLIVGGDSATVTVPATLDVDVEVESRSPMFGSGVSQESAFDLSWNIDNPEKRTEEWMEVA